MHLKAKICRIQNIQMRLRTSYTAAGTPLVTAWMPPPECWELGCMEHAAATCAPSRHARPFPVARACALFARPSTSSSPDSGDGSVLK